MASRVRHLAVACNSTATAPKVFDLGHAIAGLTLEEARGLLDHIQDHLSVSSATFSPDIVVTSRGAAWDGENAAAAPAEKTAGVRRGDRGGAEQRAQSRGSPKSSSRRSGPRIV
uniref:Uncharacterized protein n=1 Tax=Leersia perrieri TaxID=77586 RepID=A0A0D9WJW1_9ORYZ